MSEIQINDIARADNDTGSDFLYQMFATLNVGIVYQMAIKLIRVITELLLK